MVELIGGKDAREHRGRARAEADRDRDGAIDFKVRARKLESFQMQRRFERPHNQVRAVARHTLAVFAEITDAHCAVHARRHLDVQGSVERQRRALPRAAEIADRGGNPN